MSDGVEKINKEEDKPVEKIVSPLRKAMSELDYGLPEYVFDSEEGQSVADLIQKVWNEIDNVEGKANE